MFWTYNDRFGIIHNRSFVLWVKAAVATTALFPLGGVSVWKRGRLHDFTQRNHYEVAFLHAWVRQGEFRGVHGQIVVEEHVYVYGAITIHRGAVGLEALDGASEFLFYLAGFA